MVSKKQNPPPPAPPEPVEDSSEEEVEEEENEEDMKEEEGSEEEAEESDEDDEEVEKSSTPMAEETVSGADQKETESEEEEEEEEPESNNVESESPIPASTKASKSNSKRLLEASKNDVKGSRNQKRAITVQENNKRGKSTPSPGKVWSENNQIVLLKGMIDYRNQTGQIPDRGDRGDFVKFIKGKLRRGLTKRQITEKIRHLKRKNMKNKKDPSFSNSIEKTIFNLSEQIWADEIETSNGVGVNSWVEIEHNSKVKSDNPKGKKGCADDHSYSISKVDDNEIFKKFPTLSKYSDEELGFLKDNIHFIGVGNAVELEDKWKLLQMEDMNGLAKRLNLRAQQIKLVLDAMKKRSNK